MRTLKVNDFFCGCGGMGVAFKNAGFEIVGAWDFDKYAVQTYRANVGEHVRQQDIKEMTYKDVPKADVWAFGFPCQDLSVAGKQRGMVLKCEECGEEIQINPEEYQNNVLCPHCGSSHFKAASRSGCFFEIMRLLEETEENAPENMPAVIIAENVKGLRPYLPVLNLEYEGHGYTAHAQMFNSKYWNVAQNRERYAVVGTRDHLGLHFTFPEEQHEFVPKLSSQLEKDVDEKYFLPDEKAKTIIAQAAERVNVKNYHACITPDRLNKRQNGPRAKGEEEPMFTLTAQDLHGVIIGAPRAVKLQNSNMRGRRVKEPEEVAFSVTAGDIDGVIITQTESSGGGATQNNECCKYKPMRPRNERECIPCRGDSPNTDNQQGRGDKNNYREREITQPLQIPVAVLDKGKIVSKFADVSPCLMARDYKGFSTKTEKIVVIEERKET